MRIPYSIQGLFFAPALIGLVFILKISCPAGTWEGCFADNFITPVFMPIKFFYKIFSSHPLLLAAHEPLFILGYWALVGLFIGLIFDLHKRPINKDF